MKSIHKSMWKGIAVSLLVLLNFQSYASVWTSAKNESKYPPVLATEFGTEIAVLFDAGLNSTGHNFQVKIYNGLIWKDLCSFHTDSSGIVLDMIFHNKMLYVAGKFNSLAEVSKAVNVFRFNLGIRKFETLTENSQDVNKFRLLSDFEIVDGKLIGVGSFSAVDNVSGGNIISLDGVKWSNATSIGGTGFNGSVQNILVDADSIYFSGLFTKANGEVSTYLAKNVNGDWTYFPKNEIQPIKGIKGRSDLIYIGFDKIQGRGLYKLGEFGLELAEKGLTNILKLNDIVMYNGDVYASGIFSLDGEEYPQSVIKYESGNWRAIQNGSQLTGVNRMYLFKKSLMALGSFEYERLGLNHIALYSDAYSVAAGKIYYDKNNNCSFDNRDEVLNNVLIEATPGPFYGKPDQAGNYSMTLPPGKYALRVISGRYWTSSSCADEIKKVELSKGTVKDSLDFPIQYSGNVEDVKVEITSSSGWQARYGKRLLYIVKYENAGSEKINSGNVQLDFNQRIGPNATFSIKPDRLESNSATWNYTNLNPGEVRYIPVAFNIPNNLPDTEIEFTATIAPSDNETETDDNESKLTQRLSADDFENEKQVFPSAENGEEFAYMNPNIEKEIFYSINFSNFSTEIIRTVHVIDTIDVHLDISYIQETGASHAYTTTVVNGPPGEDYAILIWTFKNIELLPNPNKELDMVGYGGFIGFKLNLGPNLINGTDIFNRAKIIFDNDLETLTNTVVTRIDNTSSTENLTFSEIKLFPNPCNEELKIVSKHELITISFIDVLGRKVLEVPKSLEHEVSIDVSHMEMGIYWVNLETTRGIISKKVLITEK